MALEHFRYDPIFGHSLVFFEGKSCASDKHPGLAVYMIPHREHLLSILFHVYLRMHSLKRLIHRYHFECIKKVYSRIVVTY